MHVTKWKNLKRLHTMSPVLWNPGKRQNYGDSEKICSCQGLVSELKSLSHVQLFATPWTVKSVDFSRSEYWSG